MECKLVMASYDGVVTSCCGMEWSHGRLLWSGMESWQAVM